MREPVETAELLAFTRTVDASSLSRAAAELGVPRATVGRRLQRLEERLGVRLLRRTTRSLALTDAGEALYRHARAALEAVENAEASVRRTDTRVRGHLRVSLPPIVHPKFHAFVADFVSRFPDLRVELHLTTEHVDLKRGAFDVAVRGTQQLEPGLIARVVARSVLVAVASPDYLVRHGTPRTVRDLSHHRCLAGFVRGELPQTHWIDRKGRRLQVHASLAVNDIALLHSMAERGLGIAFLPEQQVRPSLERGRLVRVLASAFGFQTQLSVVYVEREFLPPQVRAFVDAFTAWAHDNPDALWPLPPPGGPWDAPSGPRSVRARPRRP